MVLEEAEGAVEPVPLRHAVEGVEELPHRLQLVLAVRGGAPEPRLVEGCDAQPVEQAPRDVARHAEMRSRHARGSESSSGLLWRRNVLDAGVVASGEDRAAHLRAAPPTRSRALGRPGAIDPGHRVPVACVTLLHRRHHGVEVEEAVRVHEHPVRAHREHAKPRRRHDAGEPHAAGGRPEQLGVACRRDPVHAGGRRHGHGRHVAREAAVCMVVLPVHVGGDRPADRDLARAGGHGQEPALGKRPSHERVEGGARADLHLAVHVHAADVVEQSGVDDRAARRLGRVAVAPAQPSCDDAGVVGLREELGDLVVVPGRPDEPAGRAGTSPSTEQPRRRRERRVRHRRRCRPAPSRQAPGPAGCGLRRQARSAPRRGPRREGAGRRAPR